MHADNGSGATALIEALRNNYLEGAKILLAHGASVHEKNARGETAIFFLMQNLASAAPETRAEIDQILRTAGVDPEQGRSPAGEDSP